ncbi:MAG: pyruvate kinase [Myxococcota bacterium]|nr:pyruvate kinase [Myxococcota bacterium]MDP6244675.1 pyruvate kinase [Myxococcota bacterium]MDP7075246.1 pyruvate kinase [Myxococcota bacterium]MDP7300928.1 pyruvate kinase [Myxococcota bacterium]MDP7431228.1 pyruvate kinase [Myxococcota bacterium]
MPIRQPRKTKLIATIGPACDSPEILKAMIGAGMNVARLNFSHGTHEEHHERLETIRSVSAELSANVAIMLDTKGVKIRTGLLEGGRALLAADRRFVLYTGEHPGNSEGVSISRPALVEEIEVGSSVLLDDGVIELLVTGLKADSIECKVVRGGQLEDRKGVNLPGTRLDPGPMSVENRDDLLFAVAHDIDYIAASFVRSAHDVTEIRKLLENHNAQIPVIAKIEHREAVENLREIVSEANGTMVARGDLGVELPVHQVPLVQKRIIRTTVSSGKPVITATQMLDSMERNPIPTRAEVTDVANAILDGTSAVMLSGETATGSYPVEAVRTMAATAFEAESSLDEWGHLQKIRSEPTHVVTEAVSQAAITMANHLKAAAILTLTETGFTSRAISKYRPRCPIIAVTSAERVVRRLALNWGVTALIYEGERDDDQMLSYAARRGLELGLIKRGDILVATAGVSRRTGSTNMIRVITADG